jgi:hypothetical protein
MNFYRELRQCTNDANALKLAQTLSPLRPPVLRTSPHFASKIGGQNQTYRLVFPKFHALGIWGEAGGVLSLRKGKGLLENLQDCESSPRTSDRLVRCDVQV